jgi:peptide/nickel transport system substrate-binding protein
LTFAFNSAVRPKGWFVAAAAVALGISLIAPVAATTTTTASSHSARLTLSIPGPITGCYYYGSGANASLRAILDLVRPSAFTTNPTGDLVGATGPIVQAELVSLAPQTVVYSINTSWHWSNGLAFNGEDLRQWYLRARVLATSAVDGYRDIGSLSVDSANDKVRVVFARPYADWATLFRDVSQRNRPLNCSLATLAAEPSLGPYVLTSINSQSALLTRNRLWSGPNVRFNTVVVKTNLAPRSFGRRDFVDYRSSMTQSQLTELTNTTVLDGHIGSSNKIVTVGFSPHRALTVQLAVREFLGWSIDRQQLINRELGPLTFSPGLADSALFSQGERQYPGTPGLGPLGQSQLAPNTAIPTTVGQDCVSCAPSVLAAAGFVEKNSLWRSSSGQPLVVKVAVGPTVFDQRTAVAIEAQWRGAGVATRSVFCGTDGQVAAMLAHGHADVGIFTVTTGVVPSQTARSWTSTNLGDGFDIGWRSALIDQWYTSALDTFNPNDAAATYAQIDQQITTQAWERPLFTLPSVVTWSTNVAGIYGSVTLESFVDEVPSWGVALPNSNSGTP